jgi:hypothetical protein
MSGKWDGDVLSVALNELSNLVSLSTRLPACRDLQG